MRKMMVVLLAALMLFGVSFAVKAEVQNVRLGGDIRGPDGTMIKILIP